TKPFFRTKEFLWQEGHTAHATSEGAWAETMTRLDQYESVYEDLLAIPVLKGQKPDHDKFPGADTTTTVEALMPDGKSVQAGTSHHLGQSFAEAFDITFSDEDEEERLAHTTSWGLSWRALGALIMTHSDEQGLVLPPGVAPEQVVVVPIWQEDTKDDVLAYAEEVVDDLEEAGVRVELDDRDERNPGFKFNEHELNGIPLRIEIGPHEVEDGELTLVHRPDGESVVEDRDGVADAVRDHLDEVYAKLYAAAEETLDGAVREADDRAGILGTLGQHGGYVKTPWCGDEACEEPIKEPMAAEIVMVPFEEDDPLVAGDGEETCAICGEDAGRTAYFAKSY
ncbi:MAG: His/Gly/Thr/Pro-type tRNA ligase C-terminal domain-containing protein, partial [Halorubrum sp.]